MGIYNIQAAYYTLGEDPIALTARLFIWYFEKNKSLYYSDGTKRISENALVDLTLLIAESKPEEKDMMINVVVNLTNRT
jgi:hypothetical protein